MIRGKLIGALLGFAIGHLPGALIGLFLGHLFDRMRGALMWQTSSTPGMEQQAFFFHAIFATMGHIAKSDGRVSEREIQAASRLMDHLRLQGAARQEAQQAFRAGKGADFSLDAALDEFVRWTHAQPMVMQMAMEWLVQFALLDGQVSAAKMALLERIADRLRIQRTQLAYLLRRYRAGAEYQQRQQHQGYHHPGRAQVTDLSQAFACLELPSDADGKTIKRAYRKLMSQHHPDKLASQDVPEGMRQMAKERAQAIQSAYEQLKAAGKV